MRDGIELLEAFNEVLEKEIRNVVNAGEVKPDEIDNLSKIVCMMKDSKKAEKIIMELSECADSEYPISMGGKHYADVSMRRGRSAETGRYVSRTGTHPSSMYTDDGYSMHSFKDRVVADLEHYAQNAPTVKDRLFIEKMIDKAEDHNK